MCEIRIFEAKTPEIKINSCLVFTCMSGYVVRKRAFAGGAFKSLVVPIRHLVKMRAKVVLLDEEGMLQNQKAIVTVVFAV